VAVRGATVAGLSQLRALPEVPNVAVREPTGVPAFERTLGDTVWREGLVLAPENEEVPDPRERSDERWPPERLPQEGAELLRAVAREAIPARKRMKRRENLFFMAASVFSTCIAQGLPNPMCAV